MPVQLLNGLPRIIALKVKNGLFSLGHDPILAFVYVEKLFDLF